MKLPSGDVETFVIGPLNPRRARSNSPSIFQIPSTGGSTSSSAANTGRLSGGRGTQVCEAGCAVSYWVLGKRPTRLRQKFYGLFQSPLLPKSSPSGGERSH